MCIRDRYKDADFYTGHETVLLDTLYESGSYRIFAVLNFRSGEISRSGITLEQHCKNSRTTPEALEKDYRAQAESRIRFVLAARAIAEAENIVVHPEEVNAEYRRLSQLQDTPEAEIRKAQIGRASCRERV